MANLENFLQFSTQPPKALAISQEIRDRGSIFIGSVYRATSATEAKRAINQLKNVEHASNPATCEIAAWRCMVLKNGKDGLGGPEDFEVQSGSDDDGESWAGGRALKVMQAEGVIDAVVVVSRWYGGIHLGPVRFTHIETCAREVCRSFKTIEEVETCIAELVDVDAALVELRTELSTLSGENTPSSTPAKAYDYSVLLNPVDLPKAKRLLVARQNAMKSVKSLIAAKLQNPVVGRVPDPQSQTDS